MADDPADKKLGRPSPLEIMVVIALIALTVILFLKYCAYAPDPYEEYRQQRLKNVASPERQ